MKPEELREFAAKWENREMARKFRIVAGWLDTLADYLEQRGE